jgi:2-polyprenyl-6-methoxyphenol hydroxylase-like FAD-dependent oxidoreductase
MRPGATRGTPQAVEIVGGGLAGLALGLALRRAGIPATIWEAHGYPRHRVCGEFISGLDSATVARLGLAPLLRDARLHRQVAWFRHGRPVRRQHLPAPALGLSRHALDARLAEAFTDAGGVLRVGERVAVADAPAGRVFAIGRRRRPSPWFGLKLHARGLRLDADLEVHLGAQAYVGLSAVEGGWINVCGLFRRQPGRVGEPALPGAAGLLQHLEAAGLIGLARRLRAAEIDPASVCAVAGLSFRPEPPAPDRLCLGDSLAMTPPFTGNGMAMALQSAALGAGPLADWAHGARSWAETIAVANRHLWRLFRTRLLSANLLHPFLLEARLQPWLAFASRTRLLPLRPLYQLTH